MNEWIIEIILYIVTFIIFIIFEYFTLKKPFTLSDLLFYPSENCEYNKYLVHDIDDVQFISILKWIPGINVISVVIGILFLISIGLDSIIYYMRKQLNIIKFK